VAVVGGGYAGLSAAIQLGRLNRSVVVIDSHMSRALWQQHNWNFPSVQPGMRSVSIRAAMRYQAVNTGKVNLVNGYVLNVERSPFDGVFLLDVRPPISADSCSGESCNLRRKEDMFLAVQAGEFQPMMQSTWQAKTVIWATGVSDVWPEFEGRDECIGKSLFHCTLCDGMQAKDKDVVIVSAAAEFDDEAFDFARCLAPFQPSKIQIIIRGRKFHILEGLDVKRVRDWFADDNKDGVQWFAKDGQIEYLQINIGSSNWNVYGDVFFSIHKKLPRTEALFSTGVLMNDEGYIVTEPNGAVKGFNYPWPGFFAAGDVREDMPHQVSAAVHTGQMTASAANYYLLKEG
jgi:thioredoxin reductase